MPLADPTPTWSLADTHCPWCGKEVSDSFTHAATGAGCPAVDARAGGLIGRMVIAEELRARVETLEHQLAAMTSVARTFRDGLPPDGRALTPHECEALARLDEEETDGG